MEIDPAESSPSMRQYILKMVYVLNTYLSNTNINERDSRKIGLIKITNPYRIRVRRIAP